MQVLLTIAYRQIFTKETLNQIERCYICVLASLMAYIHRHKLDGLSYHMGHEHIVHGIGYILYYTTVEPFRACWFVIKVCVNTRGVS